MKKDVVHESNFSDVHRVCCGDTDYHVGDTRANKTLYQTKESERKGTQYMAHIKTNHHEYR
ncbi:MAG: hypothetical protein NVSMB38_17150 [Ktedonobacteraceae bacterium]